MKRKSISAKIRFLVMGRDQFRCVYCGSGGENSRLVIDHITPVAAGGSNEMFNLCTACEECNAGKSDRQVSREPDPESRSAEAAERLKYLKMIRKRAALMGRVSKESEKVRADLSGFWKESFGWSPTEKLVSTMFNRIDRIPLDVMRDLIIQCSMRMRNKYKDSAEAYMGGILRRTLERQEEARVQQALQ